MKRCPQCEFIYEDDQSLCDMDGILLVFDSHQLPKPSVPTTQSRSSQWRHRTVTAFATLVLAAVLGLVYFVSTNRQRTYQQTPANAGQPSMPSMKVTAATAASESPKTPSDTKEEAGVEVKSPEPSAKSEPKETVDKPKSNVTPAAVKGEAAKKPQAKSTSTQKAQSSTQTKKTDSKIGSLIKKTGSILKKPFKF